MFEFLNNPENFKASKIILKKLVDKTKKPWID